MSLSCKYFVRRRKIDTCFYLYYTDNESTQNEDNNEGSGEKSWNNKYFSLNIECILNFKILFWVFFLFFF